MGNVDIVLSCESQTSRAAQDSKMNSRSAPNVYDSVFVDSNLAIFHFTVLMT